MARENSYASDMPIVQQEIMRTLAQAQGTALSMSDLIQEMRRKSPQHAANIRAAVLPLITLRRVELTRERKLRLAR